MLRLHTVDKYGKAVSEFFHSFIQWHITCYRIGIEASDEAPYRITHYMRIDSFVNIVFLLIGLFFDVKLLIVASISISEAL